MRINKKYDLAELGRRIQNARNSASGQPVSFQGFEIDDVHAVLDSCVEFRPGIPDADRRGLVWKAIVQAAESPKIGGETIEQALRSAENSYLQTPVLDYVLATSISVRYFDQLTRRNLDDACVLFSRQLPRRFNRGAIQRDLDRLTFIDRPGNFTSVRIQVRARTDAAAADMALEVLDLLRAFWNFRINLRTLMRHSWGAEGSKPVNAVRLGPVHTLHKPTGALACESFWYEPRHLQFGEITSLERDWESLTKAEGRVRRRLTQIRYGDELKSLLVRYVRALDSMDHEVAYNKLWSVLEHLAHSVGEYSKLIDRVLFVFANDERQYLRLILKHLRDVRNGMVHEDRSRMQIETYLYQLKFFVESLFRFHFAHGKRLGSLPAAGAFMDLPADPVILAQRERALKFALQFKNPVA